MVVRLDGVLEAGNDSTSDGASVTSGASSDAVSVSRSSSTSSDLDALTVG